MAKGQIRQSREKKKPKADAREKPMSAYAASLAAARPGSNPVIKKV